MLDELVMRELVISEGNRLRDRMQNFPWADQFLRSKIVVACSNNNEMIGACGIRGWLNYLTVYVREDYRNIGIGHALLKGMIATAKMRRIDFLTLIVSTSNYQALSLFNDLGFKEIRRYPRFIQHLSRYIDYLIMFSAISSKNPKVFFFFRVILSISPRKILSKTIEIMQGRF